MTHEDAGHYAAKHPNAKADPAIAAAIEEKQTDGRITCAAAHAIASKLGCPPEAVGVNIDLLEMRIAKCQLGLFGHGSVKGKNRRQSVVDRRRPGKGHPCIHGRRSHYLQGRLGCG